MLDKRISPIYMNKMRFVDANLDSKSGLILDAGCGKGHYFPLYNNKKLRFKAIDSSKEIASANKSITYGSLEKIPFKDKTFDTIICMDVLEHVENDKKALNELYRVLKNKGRLIISVPSFNYPFTYDPINAVLRIFSKHLPIGMWAWGHKRLYTEKQIKKMLESRFKIKKFERKTYYLATLLVNYIPYITEHVLVPTAKNLSLKKIAEYNKIDLEKSLLYRFFNFINKFDSKLFSKSKSSVTLCFLAVK